MSAASTTAFQPEGSPWYDASPARSAAVAAVSPPTAGTKVSPRTRMSSAPNRLCSSGAVSFSAAIEMSASHGPGSPACEPLSVGQIAGSGQPVTFAVCAPTKSEPLISTANGGLAWITNVAGAVECTCADLSAAAGTFTSTVSGAEIA